MDSSNSESLVQKLPWDTFPTESQLPTVDHPETREPTPYIDFGAHSTVERILFSFLQEVRALRPQPSWVPEQSLVLVAQICLLLHLKKLRHLLPTFLQHKIRDNDLPLSLHKLTTILHDDDGSKIFYESQFMATLRDVQVGWQSYAEHELIPIRTIRRLGTGSFAQVDRVELVLQKREVAHKLFTRNPKKEQKSAESIDAEIKSLKKLSGHSHIVSYLGAYETLYHFGLLLSPVAECDLSKFLKYSVELSREWGCERDAILYRAFGCLSSALTHMHSLQIRHKDIKPQNILIERREHLGVTFLFTDFGIAVDFETMTETFTTGSTVRGTRRYYAPEVAYHGQRGRRSDVYSLGCVFLEIATVLAEKTPEDLDKHLGGDGIFYESYDEIDSWIARLLETENPHVLLVVEQIRLMLRRDATSRPQAQAVLSGLGDSKSYDLRFPKKDLFCSNCWLMADGESTSASAMELGTEDSEYEDDDEIYRRSEMPLPPDDSIKTFDYATGVVTEPDLQLSQTYIEVAKIPQLRKGNALSVVNVYIAFVSCLKGYNLLAHIPDLWAHHHLRQRLDLEMLRLLNWGIVVQLVNGGPLQPAILESAEAIQMNVVSIFQRQIQIFQRILNRYPEDAKLLHTRKVSQIRPERHSEIPQTAVQTPTTLFASVMTKTQETAPSTNGRESISSDIATSALNDLELCNDELNKFLDRETAILLIEQDAETYLALLQLSGSLEDIGALLKAIEGSKNTDLQSLAKRQPLIQIARFKPHLVGVQELGLTKSSHAMHEALGGYNWQSGNATDLSVNMEDIVHFADENHLENETKILSGLWRQNGTKRLIWIEWKYLDIEFNFDRHVERVKDLTALLSYSDKPAEFCGPKCVGYVPDEDEYRVGLVYEVPDHVSAQNAFEPISLLAVLTSETNLSKHARRQLAFKLANSVLHLHSVDWLHKSFSSHSITFFRDSSGSPNLGFPIVSGFGLSRPATRQDMTERPSDDLEADIYRHPAVQRSEKSSGFMKIYDIYSLGVVLFELAYCKPVTEVLGVDLETMRNKDVYTVRRRLLSENNHLDGVTDALGMEYRNVVEACLIGVELSKLDGRCRIGLPPRVSFPLLCFDVAVNFLLTGVFFWLLRPVMNFHGILKASTWFGDKLTSKVKKSVRRREVELESALEGASLKSAMNKNIKTLLWKCLIGSTLVMLPTVANMTQFYIMNSRELGWVCLTICTLDVSWGVIIVNWLTIGSAEAENNLTSLMSQRTLRNDQPGTYTNNNNNNNNNSKPDRLSRFDVGLTTHGPKPSLEMRTRQASATTAEVPVFYKDASLRDEGGLLKQDGVRESWVTETSGAASLEGEEGSDRIEQLREPERTLDGHGAGWLRGSRSWTTVNDRVVRGQKSGDGLGSLHMV